MDSIVTVLQQISTALFGEGGAITIFFEWLVDPKVLPYFLIGVGVSLLMLAVRVVKGIFWGV